MKPHRKMDPAKAEAVATYGGGLAPDGWVQKKVAANGPDWPKDLREEFDASREQLRRRMLELALFIEE
jgi:hypothetical protein